jgi:2-octaprenyl-6-methoxyphenol hydroxylase
MLNSLKDIDIVIVGGGLVGNSLAAALSGLGFRLAIVDNKPAEAANSTAKTDGPSKALALSLTTQRFLQTLGLWADLAPVATPITAVHVSEQGRFGRTLLQASSQGLPALGFVLDSVCLEQHLSYYVRRLPDVKIMQGTTISSHRVLDNPLIIAADGAHSQLRAQAGIGVTVHDYHQSAVVANLYLKNKVQGMAYERFTQAGPIAMLPLGDRQVKCVWVVSGADRADELCALSEKAFLEKLIGSFGHRLGPFLSLGMRTSYPLVSRVADALYAERLVLMGNAAATLHPIAAQGFNLAVRDIATLAEILLQAKQSGQAIGALSTLQDYAKQRYTDRRRVIDLTHQLAQGFESSIGPVRRLRHWGLVLCDVVPALKTWIINRGVGFQYPLPKLCCGVPLCP